MNIGRGIVIVVAGLCASLPVGSVCLAEARQAVAAQSTAEPATASSLTKEETSAIERWVHDYKAWKAWYAKWRNRIEPGLFGARERRKRPDPPSVLATVCPAPAGDTGLLTDACQLFKEWSNDDIATEVIKQQVATTRAQKETEDKSVWWRHIHLDAVWPMTQGSSGVWGVVGLHTTIDISGRVELFLTPGAMVMRVPGPDGGQWKPATDWGLSFRLADFRIPTTHRPATLHVSLARVWLLGRMDDVPGVESDMYIAGFSLTFRKLTTH